MTTTHGTAWGVLILRAVLGVVFIMHAYMGYAIVTPKGTAGLLMRLGFPPGLLLALAWAVIAVHALGGALLVIGLWTRLAALLNIPVMLVAVTMVHYPQGFFLRAQVDAATGRASVVGYEFALLVLACAVAVALIGGGPLSLDYRRASPGRRR
ncbi:MAG TPA: DoxX family protein [Terriglobales bacterium]|nr:DoxX family protein [Terriglobales bacterium]